MMLMMQLVMVYLIASPIIATDASCISNESSTLNCSHMVTPDITNDTCLNSSIPCCDINTYIKNSSFKSNTTFCFLNGTHHIDLVDDILMIEDGFNISLIGLGGLVQHSLQDKVNEYNFTYYEEDRNVTFFQSPTVIRCKRSFAFIFNNINNLNLLNMAIQNCGANVESMITPIQGNDSFPNITSVAFLLISITNLMFENISVQNSTGYGFVGINMLGYSQLIGSSFIGNNQHVKNTKLRKHSYQNYLCHDVDGSCATPSVIYVTTAKDGKIHYPGGNAIFIYNHLHLSNISHISSLKIESCLFTLGVDDSIAWFRSQYVPNGDRIMGTGFGVLLFLGSSHSVTINITNTVSYRNQAGIGANFNFQETYESSVISLLNVSSTRGISLIRDGAFYYNVDHPALGNDTASSITFDRSIFSSDCVSQGTILVQNVRSLQVTECQIFGQLYACCRNGTIIITKSVLQTENCIGGIEMSSYDVNISKCTFNGAGLISSHGNVNIADSMFANCQSSAINMFYSSLQLSGNVFFTNNSATSNGGAISLSLSTVIFQAPANVIFVNNSALEKGGVLYIGDNLLGTTCCVSFDDPKGTLSNPGIQIFIDNSSAEIAGNVLYGGDIETCTFDCSKAPHYCDPNSCSLMAVFIATTKLGHNNGNQSAMVSSDATGVYGCVNDSVEFDPALPKIAYPGKRINISIITVGQLDGASPDIVTYFTCSNSEFEPKCTTPSLRTIDLQYTRQYCTNYTFQVTGNKGKNSSVLLNIILQRASTGLFSYPVIYQVTINVEQCPFGFASWNSNLSICSADRVLENYHVTNNVETLTVHRNNTIWIGNSSSSTLAVHLNCPYDYCNPSSITFKIKDEQDHQCNYNRTGVLCGGCKPNTSAVFGSNRCMSCTDQHIWLLIPFSIMGVVLVALLLLLNCTVSVGTINGLIIYANIITPGIVNRLPFSETGIFIFISWFNLNFGIETCFYNGMDTIVKTWLQFVFPAYILLLVGAFIFVSRWSSLLTRLCRRNAVGVLATLILLSYTKFLETVITILAYTKIDVSDSTANNPPVWLADGTILYTQVKHTPLLAAGVVITVTFLFPYTLILLLAPWIQAKSQWKVFSWINKLKPFIDAHQAPFKDQYRYWPGVLLMVRVVLYIVFIINEGNNINANLLAIALVLGSYAFITSRLSVYKYWPLNILENYFLINLIFLSCILLYIEDFSSKNGVRILNSSGGMSLAVLMGIIIYHLYVQLKGNSFLKHVFRRIQNKRQVMSPSVQAVMVNGSEKLTLSYGSCEYREPLLEDI